ncbi:MAG: hypothetical protein AAGA30_20970 [Planctomycetota bacterium]
MSLPTSNTKAYLKFSEVLFHDRIAEVTSDLGIGDLDVLQRERVQTSGVRLDMLLSDPQGDTRYKVEIMPGATDPSHIILCWECWNKARRNYSESYSYQGHDHIAVLIA